MNSSDDYKFTKFDLKFLIKLKARDFRLQNINNITERQIKEYLFNVKWKKKDVMPMCEIIDDIMSLDYSDVFEYLSVKVVKEASQLSINDFNEFISK